VRGQDRSERNAKSRLYALAGSGASSNAVTRKISWREIAAEQPEARKSGRMNATEINAAKTNNEMPMKGNLKTFRLDVTCEIL
jgi:hypothetical protein